jgi:hypothetical protein
MSQPDQLPLAHNVCSFYYVPLDEGHSKCFICTHIDVTENGNYLAFNQYDIPKWFCFNCIIQPLNVLTRIRKNNEAALDEFLTTMGKKSINENTKQKAREKYRKSYNENCGLWKQFIEKSVSAQIEQTIDQYIEQTIYQTIDPQIDQTIPLYTNEHLNQWFNFP